MRGVAILTYLVMHRSSFWHHRFSTALAAQAVAVVGLVSLVFAETETALTVGLAGVGLLVGYNYFASIYYSTTSTADDKKGAASGMHEGTLGLGIAMGSLAGGYVGNVLGPRAPYVLSACLIVLLSGVQVGMFVRGRPSPRAH
jgi:predicted MFS family arabinose efflux permease